MRSARPRLRPGAVLATLLLVIYPLLVYWSLDFLQPRWLGMPLIAVLVVRHHDKLFAAARQARSGERLAIALLLTLAGLVAASNSESLLLMYPALANLAMLLLFGFSLLRPPSMIERFARLTQPDLPDEAVPYTHKVTLIWCVFFLLNGSIALFTALFATRATWALYNGFITYLLMGSLFAGEWSYRRFILRPPT